MESEDELEPTEKQSAEDPLIDPFWGCVIVAACYVAGILLYLFADTSGELMGSIAFSLVTFPLLGVFLSGK